MFALKEAIENEDVNAIINAIKEHRDLIDNPTEGMDPTQYAIDLCKPVSVELLVQLGGNIHIVSKWGFTPIHRAAEYGSVTMIEKLVRLGSKVIDTPNISAETPIYKAASNGHAAAIEILVQLGSTAIDTPNGDNCTPINIAASHGHVSVIETLVRLGSIAIDTPDGSGWTPMFSAAFNGHVLAIETLVRLGSKAIDTPTVNGWTPMHVAAKKCHVLVIELLVRLGSTSVNSRTHIDETPLELASKAYHSKAEKCSKTLMALGGECAKYYCEVTPPTEEESYDIRYRVYFSQSLVSCLLFHC